MNIAVIIFFFIILCCGIKIKTWIVTYFFSLWLWLFSFFDGKPWSPNSSPAFSTLLKITLLFDCRFNSSCFVALTQLHLKALSFPKFQDDDHWVTFSLKKKRDFDISWDLYVSGKFGPIIAHQSLYIWFWSFLPKYYFLFCTFQNVVWI